jgi:hypothetical protein
VLDKRFPLVAATHYREFTDLVLKRHLKSIADDSAMKSLLGDH